MKVHIEAATKRSLPGQQGCVVWLTGLSGSGKSTIARELEARLLVAGHAAYTMDGDRIRRGLNSDLGFSPEDRDENIRRIGEVAALFAEAGLIAITAFISPYQKGREAARAKAPDGHFIEVYCSAPLAVCEARDPKGLYQKARAGQLLDFTGVDAPYEPPVNPEVVLRTDSLGVEACAEAVLGVLRHRRLVDDAEPRHRPGS
jgi:adenylyl-sulfate kinase